MREEFIISIDKVLFSRLATGVMANLNEVVESWVTVKEKFEEDRPAICISKRDCGFGSEALIKL